MCVNECLKIYIFALCMLSFMNNVSVIQEGKLYHSVTVQSKSSSQYLNQAFQYTVRPKPVL